MSVGKRLMIRRLGLAVFGAVAPIAATVLAPAATAQQTPQSRAPSTHDLAIAAGYKAGITCSATFIGGRTEAQIAADELSGIYTDYNAIVPRLAAKIDRAQGIVSVAYGDVLPPRLAIWSPATGCTTMPIGTQPERRSASFLPVPAVSGGSAAPWPMGDALPRISRPALPPVAAAFDGTTYGRSKTTGVVVLKAGQLVAERYADGFGPFTAQRTWSVAKSITGTLVGMAVKRGVLNLNAPAPIGTWQIKGDPRRAITLDNLMRMASGLHSDTAGNRTDAVYFGGTTVPEGTLHWPLEARPGTRFRYANNDILLAMLSVRTALGDKLYATFPRDALFSKIGMAHTVGETDWQGNYIGSSQVWTTARDLARFGLLYANDGLWNGERLLPQGWRSYVSTPSGPQPGTGEFGYGATFWLMNKSAGVPADTFSADGNRGQYVVIIPSRNIVIVRRGEDAGGGGFDIAKFTADIVAALH
ncbi:MAG: serine hydrolase [Sphingomonas sp.]|jgi:CubicO group peptidase (beta-lactamase class C family)